MLSGAAVLTFGQTLHQVAPTVGLNGVSGAYDYKAVGGAIVDGFYDASAHGPTAVVDVTNALLHAGQTNVTEFFTPTDGTAQNEGQLAVTVNQANWTVTANGGSTTYDHVQYPLDGTIATNLNGQSITFQTGGIASSADVVLGSALTYNAVGATALSGVYNGVTSLTNAGTYHVTPVVNTIAQEGDGTAVGSDIKFTVVSSTVTIARDAVTASAANTSIVYGNDTANFQYSITGAPVNNPDGLQIDGYQITNPVYSTSGNLVAGTYTVTPTLIAGSGLLSNYAVTDASSTLTVLPFAVTGVLSATGHTYDGTPINTTLSLTSDEYEFSFNNGTDQATAELTVIQQSDGSYLATAGVLDVTSGPAEGIYNLLEGSGTSPTGQFYYDDVVFPNNPSQVVDSQNGLVFSNGTTEVNIWSSDGSGSWGVPVGGYGFWAGTAANWWTVQNSGTASSTTLTQIAVPVSTTTGTDSVGITWDQASGNLSSGGTDAGSQTATLTSDLYLTGSDDGNYSLLNAGSSSEPTTLTATATITQAPSGFQGLGQSSTSIQYGSDFTTNGFLTNTNWTGLSGELVSITIGNGTESVIQTVTTGSDGSFYGYFSDVTLAPGQYTITYAFAGDNYQPTTTTGTLTVTQAQLTTGENGVAPTATMVYGGTSSTISGTVDYNYAAVPGTFAYVTAPGKLDIGTYQEAVVFTPTDTTDYATLDTTATLTVTPAPLTITATVSGPITYSVSNASSVITTAVSTNYDSLQTGYTITGAAYSGSGNLDAGTYTVTPNLASNAALTTGDYTVTVVPGTLIVNKLYAVLGYTIGDKVYDSTTTATVTSSYVVPLNTTSTIPTGDNVSAVYTAANFPSQNAGTYGGTVQMIGAALAGTDAGNYAVLAVQTTAASISQAPMSISATGDGGYYVDGLVGTDTLNSVFGTTPPVVTLNSGTYSVALQSPLVNYTPVFNSATALGTSPLSPPVLGIAGSGTVSGSVAPDASGGVFGANVPVPTVGIDWGFVLDKSTGRFKLITG